MNSQLRKLVLELRTEKNLSYWEIRKRLGVPESTLIYWLREFPLSEERILELRRQGWKKIEVKTERFRVAAWKKRKLKEREIYNKYRKRFKNLSRNTLFVAGLMLYLGEGNKRAYAEIALSNTDHKIIKFFIQWLSEFLKIPKKKWKQAPVSMRTWIRQVFLTKNLLDTEHVSSMFQAWKESAS